MYSSAALKGDHEPPCSHMSIMGAQHPKNTEFRSTQNFVINSQPRWLNSPGFHGTIPAS